MSGRLGTVIMPAHDEAPVIGHTLRVLLDGLDLERVEVVVACNGCTDGTVEVVRALGRAVEVLDLPDAGKAAAIAAAEARCASAGTALPRLYVDADVGLTGSAATALLEALATGAIAVRPPVQLDTAGASRVVRSYARTRDSITAVRPELWGAGVYGLSATARSRFGVFPDVVADDLFVARVVPPDDVRVVDCPPVRVRLPRTAGALVTTLTRVHRGNAQLARLHPDLAPRTTSATLQTLARIGRDPRRWADLVVFAALSLVGRGLARRHGRGWERDHTTRRPPEHVDHPAMSTSSTTP